MTGHVFLTQLRDIIVLSISALHHPQIFSFHFSVPHYWHHISLWHRFTLSTPSRRTQAQSAPPSQRTVTLKFEQKKAALGRLHLGNTSSSLRNDTELLHQNSEGD
jgi:hypothetical protein